MTRWDAKNLNLNLKLPPVVSRQVIGLSVRHFKKSLSARDCRAKKKIDIVLPTKFRRWTFAALRSGPSSRGKESGESNRKVKKRQG